MPASDAVLLASAALAVACAGAAWHPYAHPGPALLPTAAPGCVEGHVNGTGQRPSGPCCSGGAWLHPQSLQYITNSAGVGSDLWKIRRGQHLLVSLACAFWSFSFLSAKLVAYPCPLLVRADLPCTFLPAEHVPADGVRREPEQARLSGEHGGVPLSVTPWNAAPWFRSPPEEVDFHVWASKDDL